MKRVFILLLALLVSVNFVFAGGKSETKASIHEEGPVEITVWTFLDPSSKTDGRGMALAKMIEGFEAETGNKVVIEKMDYTTLAAKFLTACSVGNAPDIIWVSVSDIGNVIEQGVLEPLDNLFMKDWTTEQWANADTAAFHEGEAADGTHYQLPFSVNYIGLMVRSDLLIDAGYSLDGFANWNDFSDAVAKLTVDKDPITGVKRYGYGSAFPTSGGDTILLSNILLDANRNIWNSNGTAAWANAGGVKGVELIRDLYNSGYMSTTALTDTVNNRYEDFKAGKYAMINGPSSRLGNIYAGASFDPTTIRLIPYPSDSAQYSPSVLSGWCAGVWTGSKQKEAAGKFLEYMFFNDYLWVTMGGQPPLLRSTEEKLEAEGFFKDPSHLYVKDIINCINNASVAQPTTHSISGWKNDLNTVFQDVLARGVSPIDALIKAEKEFNERNNF